MTHCFFQVAKSFFGLFAGVGSIKLFARLISPMLYGIYAPKGTSKEVIDARYAPARKVNEKYGDSIAASLATLGAVCRRGSDAPTRPRTAGPELSRAV